MLLTHLLKYCEVDGDPETMHEWRALGTSKRELRSASVTDWTATYLRTDRLAKRSCATQDSFCAAILVFQLSVNGRLPMA